MSLRLTNVHETIKLNLQVFHFQISIRAGPALYNFFLGLGEVRDGDVTRDLPTEFKKKKKTIIDIADSDHVKVQIRRPESAVRVSKPFPPTHTNTPMDFFVHTVNFIIA